jgi:GNAT superfamily N-acetyltransferase
MERPATAHLACSLLESSATGMGSELAGRGSLVLLVPNSDEDLWSYWFPIQTRVGSFPDQTFKFSLILLVPGRPPCKKLCGSIPSKVIWILAVISSVRAASTVKEQCPTAFHLPSPVAKPWQQSPKPQTDSVIQFIYRLTKCPELSLGLFCTATPDSNYPSESLKAARPVETGRKNGALSVLMAHVVSTLSNDPVVTDNAMDYPRDWNSGNAGPKHIGHQDGGRTVCLHSLAVLPEFQHRGLGRIILTAYIQQMNGAGIADRIAIIAHEVRHSCKWEVTLTGRVRILCPTMRSSGSLARGLVVPNLVGEAG